MPKLNQLSVNNAREFLDEFIGSLFDAAKTLEEKRIEREKVEALEKVKLIERQFLQFPGAKTVRHVPPSQNVPGKAHVPPEATMLIKIGIIGTEKIDTLLADQNIDLIECSDGRIKIRKNGKIQETGFMLNEREIRGIINKFAEKTETPLVNNFLHASLGNISINAIISELIGSRFLITGKA